MFSRTCRLCACDLVHQPILHYPGMPKSAQNFPTADCLADDQPVDLNIVQCQQCGLVQLDNEPVAYYREVIRASAFSAEMAIYRQRQFAEFIDRYALKNRNIIEIGCGRGEYLSFLEAGGANGFGLEYAEDSVRHCLQAGLKVQRGYIEHLGYSLDHAPFAAFFMFNFLEHMPEPLIVLKAIAGNLADGGVGLVEVPNFDMMIRENQFTEFVTDHLCYFTSDSLRLLLGLSGFEVLECREIWDDYILSATVRKRQTVDVGGFNQAHQALRDELNAYIDLFGAGNVAIWGAGHQALAVMALTGLGAKIKYVVDSAPFKQNKLTPGTHLPIVSPQVFFQDSIDALIIMAAGYSDEVAEIVKQTAAKPLSLAILRASGLECL